MSEPLTTDEKLALIFHAGHQGWDETWHLALKDAARRAHASLLRRGMIEEFAIGSVLGVGLTEAGREAIPGNQFPRLVAPKEAP